MGTTVVPALPDVIASASGSTNVIQQSWGTVVCLAPKGASNQLSVVNRDFTLQSQVQGKYVPDPTGVINKYNRRFDAHQFYTA